MPNVTYKNFPFSALIGSILLLLISTIFASASEAENLDGKFDDLSAQIDSLLTELQAQSDELSRIKIHGNATIRIKNTTHSSTSEPLGPYGESLTEGLKLNHRMKLELEARISERLSTGGMIRLSNEDQIVFDTGPERLSSDRGSVFIGYDLHNIKWTFGYYDAHFTPLTLMRWDMEDNPEGGGASRCATCPSEGGAITAESLEELGPDLTFEGSKIYADLGDNVNVTALFARPRIAQERTTFQQCLYGANTKLLSYHKPSTSFRWLGLTAIYIKDDEKSVESPSRILYSPIENKVYGVDFNLPIGKTILLKGDFAYSILLENKLESQPEENSGNAEMLSIIAKYPFKLFPKKLEQKTGGNQSLISAGVSYLRISPEYKSVYNALSYSANSQGLRVSTSYDIIRDRLSLWVFYKWLKELESTIRNAPELLKTNSILSIGTSISLMKGLLVRPCYILESSQRKENMDVEKLDKLMNSFNIELAYNLAQDSSLSLKYQRVNHKDMVNQELNHHANILSILVSTRF